MTEDLTTRVAAEAALFGERLAFAPIRHHSPACAWMLRAMIAEWQPEVILIEGPSDLSHHIPMLAEPGTVPPIAIAAMGPVDDEGPRPVTYYPLSAHAPEFVAIRDGMAQGVEVRFIDMPCGARMEHVPESLQSEFAFTAADFIAETCKALGLRDGAELWDHLFETRLGQSDWRGFFCDVYAYCLAMRETTDPALMEVDATLAREAEMRRHIAELQGKRAIVLTGGFHTPALLQAELSETPKAPPSVESYLVAYGEDALDALSGYGAGLRYPGWYNQAWEATLTANGVPDWSALAVETAVGFAGQMAGDDRRVPLPQLTEMVAIAQGLAQMKGRDAVMLPDLFDGMRTALIKTEAGPGEPYTERMHAFLRGTRLGEVPKSAGQPPLVADARTRAKTHRVDLTDSARKRRKLDIRRKASHREAQQYFYQMALLETGLASLEAGPDFLLGSRVDLLFAEWSVGWSPFVEGALIKAAPLGATVPRAALNALMRDRARLFDEGQGTNLDAVLTLVLTGLRAGLGPFLPTLTGDLADAVELSGDFEGLAQIVLRLQAVAMPGDPLHDPGAPDLLAVAKSAFDRLIYLMADLTQTPEESLPSRIKALHIVAGVLRGPQADRFDRDRFDRAVEELLEDEACPPLLAGALMGLLVQAGLREDTALATLLRGTLGGVGLDPAEAAAALNGLLMTAPMLLWQSRTVLQGAEDALAALDDDAFLAVLPALRRSLTQLNPHETDRLAEELVDLLGLDGGSLRQGPSRFTEADLARALRIDRAIAAILKANGASDAPTG
ncbi:DUF5682 family protein [Thalassococcus sp. S3]|uniref:DUF5682 family protein n=1 Tax=Thalassococcus sp. S3 TaxID=2017482 RepID=UPI001024931C|nr:DUF5682 family protein [Thalassococcus sp. S3]QBF33428.1 hypothetical protein CFI11_19760 [Thalassococcus sp. S3]